MNDDSEFCKSAIDSRRRPRSQLASDWKSPHSSDHDENAMIMVSSFNKSPLLMERPIQIWHIAVNQLFSTILCCRAVERVSDVHLEQFFKKHNHEFVTESGGSSIISSWSISSWSFSSKIMPRLGFAMRRSSDSSPWELSIEQIISTLQRNVRKGITLLFSLALFQLDSSSSMIFNWAASTSVAVVQFL